MLDAPEKRQDYGNRSKQSLSDLAYRQQAMAETHKTDRYGRQVGKVIINGLDVNLEQARRGMAWHYRTYAREQAPADQQAYADADAENGARAARKGLWGGPTRRRRGSPGGFDGTRQDLYSSAPGHRIRIARRHSSSVRRISASA